MNKQQSQLLHRVFTRRVALLGAGQLALLSTLIGRMYFLQVVEADKYKMLSDENRINRRLSAAPLICQSRRIKKIAKLVRHYD